jgi:hypothetical protein
MFQVSWKKNRDVAESENFNILNTLYTPPIPSDLAGQKIMAIPLSGSPT